MVGGQWVPPAARADGSTHGRRSRGAARHVLQLGSRVARKCGAHRHAAEATAPDFTCPLPARGTTSLHRHPSSTAIVQLGSRVARRKQHVITARSTWPGRPDTGGAACGTRGEAAHGTRQGTRDTHRRSWSRRQIFKFRMESDFAPVTKVARLYVIYSPIPFFLVFETTHMVDGHGVLHATLRTRIDFLRASHMLGHGCHVVRKRATRQHAAKAVAPIPHVPPARSRDYVDAGARISRPV